MVIIDESSEISAFIFRRSTSTRSLPFGLRCAKIGLAYFEEGRVVIKPYLCFSANSTVKSSLKFIGTGKLCVYIGRSSKSVNFTLKLFFIPMLSRWRAKISLYSNIAIELFSVISFDLGFFPLKHV